jgi:hypothetical protein
MKMYKFSENFYHDRPPSADELIVWLRKAIAEIGFRVVVLDSLSAFKKTQDGVRETLKLMRELRALKDELNISILVIADCPEQKRGKTLTGADLGRSAFCVRRRTVHLLFAGIRRISITDILCKHVRKMRRSFGMRKTFRCAASSSRTRSFWRFGLTIDLLES